MAQMKLHSLAVIPYDPRYSSFKQRYRAKWAQCLPFRSASEFAECNECFNLKKHIKEEKARTPNISFTPF